MILTSSDFADQQQIPPENTCKGTGNLPKLKLAGVPEGTQSIALTVLDPDAPNGTFVHLLAWNGSPQTSDISGLDQFVLGTNSGGAASYTPPCPPAGSGAHRYIFTIYALSSTLPIPAGSNLEAFRIATEGQVLAKSDLTGLFEV